MSVDPFRESDAHRARRRAQEKTRELRSYVLGFVLAAILTAAPFALVWSGIGEAWTLTLVAAAALLQVVVHFRFFLHISLDRSTRDDLQLILFTALIVAMMAGGTIWIMGNLHTRMM